MIRMYLILIPYLFPYTTLFRSSDTNGTVANFNVTFLDVASITLTPAGTQQRSAVYDYKDVVYEGTYSFSGNVITVSVPNHGLLEGMAVRLSLTGRTPKIGRAHV